MSLSKGKDFDETCRPIATRFQVSSDDAKLKNTSRLLWSRSDDKPGATGIVLATANYVSPNLSRIKINAVLSPGDACAMRANASISLELLIKFQRWWPWNIVRDLVYSV